MHHECESQMYIILTQRTRHSRHKEGSMSSVDPTTYKTPCKLRNNKDVLVHPASFSLEIWLKHKYTVQCLPMFITIICAYISYQVTYRYIEYTSTESNDKMPLTASLQDPTGSCTTREGCKKHKLSLVRFKTDQWSGQTVYWQQLQELFWPHGGSCWCCCHN